MMQPTLFPMQEHGGSDDWWETPPEAIEPIMPVLKARLPVGGVCVVEPACGTGNILAAAIEWLAPVAAMGIELDLDRAAEAWRRLDTKAAIVRGDFFGLAHALAAQGDTAVRPSWLIENPPYTKPRETTGLEFWEESIRWAQPDGLVAMLLPLDFATGVDRSEAIHDRYQTALYPLRRRPKFGNNSTGQRPVAWFVTDLARPYSEFRVIG